MKRLRSILKGIGMGLCVLGFLWFLMPLLKGGTGIGMMRRCSRLCAGLLVVAWLPVAEPEGQLAADSGSCGIGLLCALDFVGVAISLY